nr:helix-turn-helix domain-containing protein [Ensifer sp. ENS09]
MFKEDWHERVNEYVQQWTAVRGLTISTLSRTDKQALVIALSSNGAFGGKNAASYISRILGMGRATVYKYLSQGSAP